MSLNPWIGASIGGISSGAFTFLLLTFNTSAKDTSDYLKSTQVETPSAAECIHDPKKPFQQYSR